MQRYRGIVAVVLLTAVTSGIGCRRDGAESSAVPAAPETLEQLLPWAVRELNTPLEPVPVPNSDHGSRVPTPGTATAYEPPVRLAALMGRAEVRCEWRPPRQSPDALLVFERRSYDEPGPNAEARVLELERGRFCRCLTLGRLELDGTKVGRILLRADFGEAREFNLTWSLSGRVTFPIARPGETSVFDISTDDLSDWNRKITFLRIGVPALDGNDVVIEELRFLPHESAYPEAVGRRRIMFGDRLRETVYTHCPSEIVFGGVALPKAGRFETGLAVTGSERARFTVVLHSGGRRDVLLERKIAEADTWVDVNVALPEWAGERADVILSTDGPAGAVACWGDPKFYAPMDDPPRVLVYLIDTLGATHMSLYGYHRDTTPHLEALARRGVRFTNAFANASRTVESIPNIMLSMPTVSHGVRDKFSSVADGLDLLAEDFLRAGFATACFSTNVNAGPRQHLDRGFADFWDHFAYFWSADSTRTVPIEEVAGWMDRHRDRPMFVYVHTAEPHSPYEAPPPFGNRYDPDYTGPITGSHINETTGFQQARTRRDIEHVVALYDGEVAYADHQFGLFMDRVAELGLDAGLITLVTSDHGEQFLEHGLWKHGGDLHGELLRVPLIIAGPPGLVPHVRVEQAVQLLDIRPTLLDLCGLVPSAKMYGDSLRGLMAGREADHFRDRALFASTYQPMPPHHALIRWPWKLMFEPQRGDIRASFSLFDIVEDPAESRDVFDLEPDVAARMIRELVRTRAAFPRYASPETLNQTVLLDMKHIERLKALGYID